MSEEKNVGREIRGFGRLGLDAETYLDLWTAAAPHVDTIMDSFTVQD